MKLRPHRRLHRQGLTLIELLIVVLLAMTLAALLFAGLDLARDMGRTTKCFSNQRQITLALMGYGQNWFGTLPMLCYPTSPSTGNYGWSNVRQWDNALVVDGEFPTAEFNKVFTCPGNFLKGSRSYGGNGNIGAPGANDHFPTCTCVAPDGISNGRPLGNRLSRVESASATLLTCDAGNLGTLRDYFAVTTRHRRGRAGILAFVDGHAKVVEDVLLAPPGSGQDFSNPAYYGVYTSAASDNGLIMKGRY